MLPAPRDTFDAAGSAVPAELDGDLARLRSPGIEHQPVAPKLLWSLDSSRPGTPAPTPMSGTESISAEHSLIPLSNRGAASPNGPDPVAFSIS